MSLLIIGVLALSAVNFASIEALSSATSGGFLLVYAAGNIAAVRLAPQTGTNPVIPGIAALLCLIALAITIWQFVADPATVVQAYAIGAIVVVAAIVEGIYRPGSRSTEPSPAKSEISG